MYKWERKREAAHKRRGQLGVGAFSVTGLKVGSAPSHPEATLEAS